MKLRYCLNLISTPDFTEIRNLKELNVEGCVNLVEVHPSIELLKKLVVLNMRNCIRFERFPLEVEMDSLQVLSLSGCLKLDKLPEFRGRTKTFVELHINRTAIKELPSSVFSQENLESLPFVRPNWVLSKWWMSSCRFSLPSTQQYPRTRRSVSFSLAGLHKLQVLHFSYCNLEQVPDAIGGLSFLKSLKFSYCNLERVPESIGGLSCLERLNLSGNNFTSLPGSLSRLSSLELLDLDGCKKLEVLPELPHSLVSINACGCTSLCSITGLFSMPGNSIKNMGIIYKGNSIPNWFTNKSMRNHVKVELPLDLDWSVSKFRGYGFCVVFKRKKPFRRFGKFGYTVKNFDGAYLGRCDPYYYGVYFSGKPIRIDESDMICLHYTTSEIQNLKEAKNFVTFSFYEDEDIEVKECGARIVCDEDLDEEGGLSMFEDLPTLSQHCGVYEGYRIHWSW